MNSCKCVPYCVDSSESPSPDRRAQIITSQTRLLLKQPEALSRRKVLETSSLIKLTVNGKSTKALLEVPSIGSIVRYAVRTAAIAARLWVQSKYILDIMIYMKQKRTKRNIYVVQLTTKKTKSTAYPGSREGYHLYPTRERNPSAKFRGNIRYAECAETWAAGNDEGSWPSPL